MTMLITGSLPYLFSSHGCSRLMEGGLATSRAARFLDAFEPLPGEGTLRFPEIAGDRDFFEVSPALMASDRAASLSRSAAALLGSVHSLLRERGVEAEMILPCMGSAWHLCNFTSLSAFGGEAGGIALEGLLGQVLDVSREDPQEPWVLDAGWRSPVSSVLQNISVSSSGRRHPRVAYFIEFIDLGVASLRKYMGWEKDKLDGILRYLGHCVMRSGLYPQSHFGGFDIRFSQRRGLDEWSLSFSKNPGIEIQASSHLRNRGEEGPEAFEEISLSLPLPDENAFRPLGPHLQPLWNFGETIAYRGGDPRPSLVPEN